MTDLPRLSHRRRRATDLRANKLSAVELANAHVEAIERAGRSTPS